MDIIVKFLGTLVGALAALVLVRVWDGSRR